MAERVPQNEQTAQLGAGAGAQAAGVGGGLPGGDLGQVGAQIGRQIDSAFKALADMDDFGLQQQAEYNLRAMQVTAGQEIQRRMALPDGDEESLFEADGRLRQTAVRDLVNSYTADIEDIGRLPISAQRRAAVQGKAAQTALDMLNGLMSEGFKAQQQKTMDNFQNNYQLALTQEDYGGATSAVQNAVAAGLISASKGRLLLAQTAKRGARSRISRAISDDPAAAAEMLNSDEVSPLFTQSEMKQMRNELGDAAAAKHFQKLQDDAALSPGALAAAGDMLGGDGLTGHVLASEDGSQVNGDGLTEHVPDLTEIEEAVGTLNGDGLMERFSVLNDTDGAAAGDMLGGNGLTGHVLASEDGAAAKGGRGDSGGEGERKRPAVTDVPVMTEANARLYTALLHNPGDEESYNQLEAHAMARAGAFDPQADSELEKGKFLKEFDPFVKAGIISRERLNAIWSKAQKDAGEMKSPTIDIKEPLERLSDRNLLVNLARWGETEAFIGGASEDFMPPRTKEGKDLPGGKAWQKYRDVPGVMQKSDLMRFLDEKGRIDDKKKPDMYRLLEKSREAVRRYLLEQETKRARAEVESQWNLWRSSKKGKEAGSLTQAEELRNILKRVTGNSGLAIDISMENENIYQAWVNEQNERRKQYYAEEENTNMVPIPSKAAPARPEPPSHFVARGAQGKLTPGEDLAVNQIRVPKDYNLPAGSYVLLTFPGLKNAAMYAQVADNTASQIELSRSLSPHLRIGPGEDITVNLKEVSREEGVYGARVAEDKARAERRDAEKKQQNKKAKGKR